MKLSAFLTAIAGAAGVANAAWAAAGQGSQVEMCSKLIHQPLQWGEWGACEDSFHCEHDYPAMEDAIAKGNIEHDVKPSAVAFHCWMASNFAENVRKAAEEIQVLPYKEQFEILNAKDMHGTSGLAFALAKGHATAVRVFGELLNARKKILTPPIFISDATRIAFNVHPSLISIRFDSTVSEEIPAFSHEEQLEILAAKRKDGTPGFYFALKNGHADAVKAFGEPLMALNISGQDLLGLLAARENNGTPGLYFAFQNGYSYVITAFAELLKTLLLKTLNISSRDLVDLLAAKRSDGVPGLAMALKNGHADIIIAFGDVLEALTDCLSSDDVAYLLTASDSHGQPGIRWAFENRHADAIKAYDVLSQKMRKKYGWVG